MTDPVKEAREDAADSMVEFITCPECDSTEHATMVVDSDHDFGEGNRRVAVKGSCKECGHESPLLPIAPSERQLHERINAALYE